MKIPRTPPSMEKLSEVLKDPSRFQRIIFNSQDILPKDKYPHWDNVRYLKPPKGMSHQDWWLALKLQRQTLFKQVPLKDRNGRHFRYLITDPIPERLHKIDLRAGGRIEMPAQITNPETRHQYYIASLIEEAITSSQLEGASTTRQVAKEMIREGRKPRDRSERMILNNYLTMKEIGSLKNERLTKGLILEIHRLVTEKTIDDASAAGRLRRRDEAIYVSDPDGTVLHRPPSADELEERLDAMCDFANGKTPKRFLYPTLRSIILHFWLAYDHPFVDGNGRTARALFYWSMLHYGYWLCEYISISHILRKAPDQYSRAFLYTETDDNDLTYFIIYHLDVIDRAIRALHTYIRRKTEMLTALETELKRLGTFNHRQRALLSHALRHPNGRYTIQSHQTSQGVVYQTARLDLFALERRGLLNAKKVGRRWYFFPANDLEEKLTRVS